MSYQVLARKFRPQIFSELVGQPHVQQALMNALKGERLPHALLFTGARGVGKTSSARILAKSLRCPNAIDHVPCGNCPECEDIAAGTSLNVIEIDGASNNGVDAIRELRETVAFMPSSGKYKIYIIDEVHMLSTSAFNALLKTLEEPPPHVIFIFATTEPQKIPATILSRCQRFDFRKISTQEIAAHLKRNCERENVEFSEEALWLIARQGDGSMRDSQSLLDQVINFTNGKIEYHAVVDIVSLTDRSLLLDTLKAFANQDRGLALDVIAKLFASGTDVKTFLNDLTEQVRNLLVLKLDPESAHLVLDLPESEIGSLKDLTTHVAQEDLHLIFDMLLKGYADATRSPNPRITLEMILLRILEAPRMEKIDSLLTSGASEYLHRPPNTGVLSNSKEIATPAASPAGLTNYALNLKKTEHSNPSAHSESKSIVPGTKSADSESKTFSEPSSTEVRGLFRTELSLEENWTQLIQAFKKKNQMLAAQLEYTAPITLTDKNLILGVKKSQEFLVKSLSESRNAQNLKAALLTMWSKNLDITFQVLEANPQKPQQLSPKDQEEKKLAKAQNALQNEVEEHPLVKKTKALFKSEVKQIKE